MIGRLSIGVTIPWSVVDTRWSVVDNPSMEHDWSYNITSVVDSPWSVVDRRW